MANESKSLPRATGSWRTRVKRTMMEAVLVLAAVLLVGVGYLFIISPGRPSPIRNANGDVIPGSLRNA
jgi:hypothetical protein